MVFKTMVLRKNVYYTAMIMLLKVSLTLSPTLFLPPSNVSKWRGLRGLEVPALLQGGVGHHAPVRQLHPDLNSSESGLQGPEHRVRCYIH